MSIAGKEWAVLERDVDELVDLLLIYVPSAPAKQLLGDLYRSKAADNNGAFKETVRRLQRRLDATHPTPTYTR